MRGAIRRTKFVCLLAAAALVLMAVPAAEAQVVETVTNVNDWGGLEYGNGEKMAVGRFNTLHGVYEDGGLIKYVTSSDGYSWTLPALVSGTSYLSALPAVTVDSAGTVAVAFVGHYNSSTGLGRIYYAFKPLGATSWTVCEIVTNGTQPDITSRGQNVYVTWTTYDRVQYLTFGTQAPPSSPVSFGEEIDINTCPGSRFVRPSIAVVRRPCDPPVPKVAYLVEFDETSNPDPVCASLITKVGPRVCTRSDAGVWSLEWSDLLTATNPPNGVEGVSLSLNSNQRDGHVFLAWSDVSNGTARTRLAHGKNAAWNAVNHSTEPMHVHVQAKPNDTSAKFRFSWVDEGPYTFIPFVSTDAFHRSGTWASGAAPSWIEASPVQIDWILIGRPQAQWWGQCQSGNYSRIRNFVEAEQVCANVRLATDYETGLSCPPPGGIIAHYPCDKYEVQTARIVGDLTLVDTADLGTLVRRTESSATYAAGEKGTIQLTWSGGTVVNEWETGFSVKGLGDLRVDSEGVSVKHVDAGYLREYDETCDAVCGCHDPKGGGEAVR